VSAAALPARRPRARLTEVSAPDACLYQQRIGVAVVNSLRTLMILLRPVNPRRKADCAHRCFGARTHEPAPARARHEPDRSSAISTSCSVGAPKLKPRSAVC